MKVDRFVGTSGTIAVSKKGGNGGSGYDVGPDISVDGSD